MFKTGVMIAMLLLSLVTLGCDSTLKSAELNSEGRLDTIYKVDKSEILIAEPFKPELKRGAYIRFGVEDMLSEKYMTFYAQTLRNTGEFENVYLKQDLEQLVIQKDLAGKVTNVNDLIALNILAKEIGPFLVIEPSTENTYPGTRSAHYTHHFKAIDPTTGKILLHIKRSEMLWSGFDQQLLYPPMNTLLDWMQGKPLPGRE